MKSLLPLKSRVSVDPDGARVVSFTDDRADELFDTLASSTSRQILTLLYEAPRPATELAEETGTTVQNIRYHLEKLRAADLVTVADTWYSEKGYEMAVYAPTEAALVLCAGTESTTGRLKSALARLLGAVAVFGVLGIVVQSIAERYRRPQVTMESVSVTSGSLDSASQPLATLLLEPGVVFFLGCLVALVVLAVALGRRSLR